MKRTGKDVRVGYKLGQIGSKWDFLRSVSVRFGTQRVLDWTKIGQIFDFLRSVSVHFGSSSQNALKSDLKKCRIFSIWGPSDQL